MRIRRERKELAAAQAAALAAHAPGATTERAKMRRWTEEEKEEGRRAGRNSKEHVRGRAKEDVECRGKPRSRS